MSDPVIVAIITTAGGLLVAFITHRRKRNAASQVVIRSNPKNASSVPMASSDKSHDMVAAVVPKQQRITDHSHQQIADAIEAVPPFHREKIHDSFVGFRVSWRTKLSNIHRNGDEMTVVTNIPDGSGVMFCRARPEDCEAFILATEGTDILVTGQIERISKYEATLVQCKFSVLSKSKD